MRNSEYFGGWMRDIMSNFTIGVCFYSSEGKGDENGKACTIYGDVRNACKILVKKTEGKQMTLEI
jgi:hypothetical protein